MMRPAVGPPLLFGLLLAATPANAAQNGAARTPPMVRTRLLHKTGPRAAAAPAAASTHDKQRRI